MEQQLIDSLQKLLDTLESTRIHTWHGKETPHAHLLAELTGTFSRAQDPKSLHRFYSQMYSQHGEDGYIAEIFSRIGCGNRTFLEIGVENGLQNTTRLLLEQGWQGIWIEGNPDHAAQARDIFADYIAAEKLEVICSKVTAENINDLISQGCFGTKFDLVTIDIDYNTSHIWRSLQVEARVYCVEYNASIPPSVASEVAYAPEAVWDGSNYFGAGLKVIERIGHQKRASLVGCDLQGVNAFLVADEELSEHFSAPFTAEHHYELPKYHLGTHIGHLPSRHARKWVTSS